MTRSVAYGQAYIYTLTDWARCPFPLGEPTTHVDYMMCRKGVPTNCYRSTHGVGSVQIARDVRAAGLPLVEAKPVWKTEGIPSARFIGHSKRSNTWDVTVTVRSAHRSVVLHQWTLLTGAASTSCDQQSLQVVADTAASGSQTASASITCGGSAQASAATTARATYSVRGRSPWASVRVSSNGRASYTATNVPSGVTTDSFAIVAEVGSATFERHVTVNLTRHAVGTDDNDAMVGSNTNVTASGTKSARAKRPSARGDVLLGGGGHDTIHGRGGDDLLRGQAGSDVLYPGPGANVTEGGVGNDRIFVVSPLDVVSGGAGNDTITIQSKVGPRRIRCGPGRDTVIAARPLRLPKDCERLVVRKAKR